MAEARHKAKTAKAEEKRQTKLAKRQAKLEAKSAKSDGRQQADTDRVAPEDVEPAGDRDRTTAPALGANARPAAAAATTTVEDEPAARQPRERAHAVADPAQDPESPRFRARGLAAMAAGVVGVLGLILSVVLAVGALIVALGAGEGNTVYDVVSVACDALVGPLKNAFDFSGPNAASREEFLGWGAGSLIYLAISFAGQAGHRAGTRA